jgi:hypothetical protein
VYSKIFLNGSFTQAQVLHVKELVINIEKTQWSRYIQNRPDIVLAFPHPFTLALEVWPNVAAPQLDLTEQEREFLLQVKTGVYAERAFSEALQVQQGTREPLVFFRGEDALPSIFINFRIKNKEELAKVIPLPKGFHLSPIHLRSCGPQNYYLSLNVYLAGGLIGGFRAEWNVFVSTEKQPNTVRFMIVDIATSEGSFDPVQLFTPPADLFTYEVDEEGLLKIQIEKVKGTNTFSATLPFPDPNICSNDPDCTKGQSNNGVFCDKTSSSFFSANDEIHYTNGLYDLARSDARQFKSSVVVVDESQITLDEQTQWSEFLELDSAILFQQPLEFILSPMYNLGEINICEVP